MIEVRPFPAVVGRWERADQERWVELAGYQLDAGVRPDLADQAATALMAKVRKARAA